MNKNNLHFDHLPDPPHIYFGPSGFDAFRKKIGAFFAQKKYVLLGGFLCFLLGAVTFVALRPSALKTNLLAGTQDAELFLEAQPTQVAGVGSSSVISIKLRTGSNSNITTATAYIDYPTDRLNISASNVTTSNPYNLTFRNIIDESVGRIEFSVSTLTPPNIGQEVTIGTFTVSAAQNFDAATIAFDNNYSLALIDDRDNTNVLRRTFPVTLTMPIVNTNENQNGNANNNMNQNANENTNINNNNNGTSNQNTNSGGPSGNSNTNINDNSNANSNDNGNANLNLNSNNNDNTNINGTANNNGNTNANNNNNQNNGNLNLNSNTNINANGNVNINTNRNSRPGGGGGGGGGSPYHSECRNNQCIYVLGAGPNLCSTPSDCTGGSSNNNQPPIFSNISPTPFSVGNPANPLLSFEITEPDINDQVNRSSVRVTIDGQLVTPTITGDNDDHLYVSYQLNGQTIPPSRRVYVQLDASDTHQPPATREYDYWFVIGNDDSNASLCSVPLNLTGTSQGESITLNWTQPNDSRITGYKLYIGESSTNLNRVEYIANINTVTLGGFTPSKTYYFVLTAVGGGCSESNYSNMIALTIGNGGSGSGTPSSPNPNIPSDFDPGKNNNIDKDPPKSLPTDLSSYLPAELPKTGTTIFFLIGFLIAGAAYIVRKRSWFS